MIRLGFLGQINSEPFSEVTPGHLGEELCLISWALCLSFFFVFFFLSVLWGKPATMLQSELFSIHIERIWGIPLVNSQKKSKGLCSQKLNVANTMWPFSSQTLRWELQRWLTARVQLQKWESPRKAVPKFLTHIVWNNKYLLVKAVKLWGNILFGKK